MKIFYCIALLLLLGLTGTAQSSDSATADSSVHSVAKATWMSAALPGLGQIYNRKYWKLPIVYGGLYACGYFAVENHRQYRSFLNAFYARIDSNQTDQYANVYTAQQLVTLQNIYRKWRDLSIIIGAAVYALQIVDAHVDAHLFDYNVNDDLSLRFEPAVFPAGPTRAVGIGLSLQWE